MSVIGFAVLIINEAITGLLIGFIANICNSIVLFAGTMIDMDIGLSMAQEFNPEMNTQVSITGNVYYYLTMLLLLVSNMHLYVLQAACDSFHLIPVGGVTFVWDDMLAVMTKYMVDLFVIAFRIFLPFFACMLVLNCILGVMAKVAPQMNMFSVGIQLKVLVGLVVLFLTIFLLPTVVQMLFDEVKILVISIVEGIH